MYGFMKAWLANIVRDTRKIESKENNKKTSRSESIHIPLDLIVEIFSKLPVKSLVRLRCLSKLWSSLITVSIMSLTKPRLLVIFDQYRLLESSLFSLSSYPLNMNHEISISAEQDSYALVRGLNCNIVFQYIRGLIFCLSRSGQFAIYNPTTRQSLLLPEIKWEKPVSFADGLFGYDPVENQYKVLCMLRGTQTLEDSYQVFTLGDPNKQWRNIQGFGQYFSPTMTTRVCINGKVYFRASVGRYGNIPKPNSSRNVLLSFDVRSERFNHIQIPNQSRNLTLVNYQGRLGCIDYSDGNVEMWIMDNQTEKQEWSKNIFFPCLILN